VRRALVDPSRIERESSPGVFGSQANFEEALDRFGPVFVYAKEGGKDIREASLPADATFVFSDNQDLMEAEERVLTERGALVVGPLLRADARHPEEGGSEPRERRRRGHDRCPAERLAVGDLLRPRGGRASSGGKGREPVGPPGRQRLPTEDAPRHPAPGHDPRGAVRRVGIVRDAGPRDDLSGERHRDESGADPEARERDAGPLVRRPPYASRYRAAHRA